MKLPSPVLSALFAAAALVPAGAGAWSLFSSERSRLWEEIEDAREKAAEERAEGRVMGEIEALSDVGRSLADMTHRFPDYKAEEADALRVEVADRMRELNRKPELADGLCHWISGLQSEEFSFRDFSSDRKGFAETVRNFLLPAEKMIFEAKKGTWDGLKNIGVVMKRARYFLLCKGKPFPYLSRRKEDFILAMMSPKERALFREQEKSWFQPSLFDESGSGYGREERYAFTDLDLPGLDDSQKEALQCVRIPVFS